MRMSLRDRFREPERGSAVAVDFSVHVTRALLMWDDESPWNSRVVTGEGRLNGDIAGG
jgi:hypothetical protein